MRAVSPAATMASIRLPEIFPRFTIRGLGRGGDFCNLPRVLGHDGRCPQRQQSVGAVMDGNVIGNAVDERRISFDPLQKLGKLCLKGHRFSLLMHAEFW